MSIKFELPCTEIEVVVEGPEDTNNVYKIDGIATRFFLTEEFRGKHEPDNTQAAAAVQEYWKRINPDDPRDLPPAVAIAFVKGMDDVVELVKKKLGMQPT